jgi:3-hydroxyacyl-[acyl-carrier-protein] dehydratase
MPFDWRFTEVTRDGPAYVLTTVVDPDSAVFAGHFPGRPVVPGVCLVDLVDRAARVAGVASGPPAAVDRARFTDVTLPGDRLVVRLTAGDDAVDATVLVGDRVRCRIRLRYGAVPWT